jgi:DNA topoisomerase-3
MFRSWHSCPPESLFHARIETFVSESSKSISDTLRQEARGSKKVILWLDNDREGENIAFEVLGECQKANARIEGWRARFSAFIPR